VAAEQQVDSGTGAKGTGGIIAVTTGLAGQRRALGEGRRPRPSGRSASRAARAGELLLHLVMITPDHPKAAET